MISSHFTPSKKSPAPPNSNAKTRSKMTRLISNPFRLVRPGMLNPNVASGKDFHKIALIKRERRSS